MDSLKIKDIDYFVSRNDPEILSNYEIIDSTRLLYKNKNIFYANIENVILKIDEFKVTTGIMIGRFFITKGVLFLFILDNQIIIINRTDFQLLQPFFLKNKSNVRLYFLDDECKKDFEQMIANNYPLINNKKDNFDHKNLNQEIICQLIKLIITKSQIRTQNRYKENKQNFIPTDFRFNLTDFIEISQMGVNVEYSAKICLYFNIKDQFLYVLKSFKKYDSELKRQYDHEIAFYESINNENPLVSKCYGKMHTLKEEIIIIEYIEGPTLLDFIKKLNEKISFNDLFRIVCQIIIAIEYAQKKGFVLRDLKPNNIIIDSQNDAIFIDFDRSRQILDEEENTGNIGSDLYAAPEIYLKNEFSMKSDIFSLGKIIEFILMKIESKKDFELFINEYNLEYKKLVEIKNKSIKEEASMRPDISNIVEDIFLFNPITKPNSKTTIILNDLFSKRIKLIEPFIKASNDFLNCMKQVYFIKKDEDNKDVSLNFDKTIHYLSILADQNDSNAQCILGGIYLQDELAPLDITKAIYYLMLSTDQNNAYAQFLLGDLYCSPLINHQDIEKAIHYLTLSSNQNNAEAQFLLGFIYYEGKYVLRDIKKALNFFTLSLKQNNSKAALYIGYVYYKHLM